MTGLRIDGCRLLIKTVTKVWLRFSLPNLKQLFEPRQSAFNGPTLVEQHKAFTGDETPRTLKAVDQQYPDDK
jgi:hypothetical protein